MNNSGLLANQIKQYIFKSNSTLKDSLLSKPEFIPEVKKHIRKILENSINVNHHISG